MEITKQLARKCYDLKFDDLPDDVIDRAKYVLLDYIGVAARGALSESSKPVHQLLESFGTEADGAVVIGTGLKVNSPYAALANGTAAHAIELDDVVNSASLHPAVTVMSASIAAAHLFPCTGKALIEAIVAGYEATVKLGMALNPTAHYARGFHPTATCGTLGSAVAASKIMKLDTDKIVCALGIAGSQAAGSMEYLSDGSFTKRLHGGWAAHSGLMAALLAKEGFTGPATIIEGKSGFLHSYSLESNPDLVLKDWGNPFQVLKTSIKPHSCCRYKQGPIDGVLQVMAEHHLTSGDIDTMAIGVLKTGMSLVVTPEEKKYNPAGIVDAQFSMPFGAAVAAMYGKATLDEYTMENIQSPEVKSMMDRVVCTEDESLEPEFPKKWPASVTIKTKTGEEFSARIEYPKGDPENPLVWEELINKFRMLTSPVYQKEKADEIVDCVRSVEKLDDVNDLEAILANT